MCPAYIFNLGKNNFEELIKKFNRDVPEIEGEKSTTDDDKKREGERTFMETDKDIPMQDVRKKDRKGKNRK